MKLKVWTETEQVEPTRVRLVPGIAGQVDLCVVDANGDRVSCGTIGALSSKGFERHKAFSAVLGFPRDDKGRIADI